MIGQFSPGQVIFNGNSVTPTNVLINSSGTPFLALNCGYQIQYLKFETSGGNGLFAENGGNIIMGPALTTGACSGAKIRASYGGQVQINNSYTDTGNAQQHYTFDTGGQIIVTGGITITESGTPAYSSAFALGDVGGILQFQATPTAVAIFSGSATGVEYNVSSGAILNTQGSGGSYLPGSSGGTSTGGYYI
jgi:hypothetical protein